MVGVHGDLPGLLTGLYDASDNGHDIILRTALSSLVLHLLDTSAPLLLRNTFASYYSLSISHTRVDVNVFRSDKQWAVCWPEEPAIDLPTQVEEDEQRTSEVELEKVVGTQVRAADRIQCYVKLTHESENVDEQAHIRAPDAEEGPEWELVHGMTVGSPVSG